MPFFPRDEKEIVSEAIQRMGSQTKINQLAPGSKARFFLTTTAREQERQQSLFDANLLQPYIKYSEGKFLDFFGDMMNLPRLESTHAESINENFMFYVQTGKFGDVNGGSPFTIPSGTTVSTVQFEAALVTPGLEAQPVIEYKTTREVTCEPDASYVYAPIRASLEGEESSVPRNSINTHVFIGYSLSQLNSLKCTNKFSIDNGTDRESDDSYRFRLSSVFEAKEQAVYASIRLAALSIPGVNDIKLVNAEQGPGSFSLYVQSTSPTPSPSLLRSVSDAVNQVTSYGIRPFISAPSALGLELVAAVNWSPRATKEEIAIGYQQMRNRVEQYVNELDIGDSILFSDLISEMLAVAPKANRIGQDNVNSFEEVYVHRRHPEGEGTIRSLVFNDELSPLYNERILLETSTRYRGIQFLTF